MEVHSGFIVADKAQMGFPHNMVQGIAMREGENACKDQPALLSNPSVLGLRRSNQDWMAMPRELAQDHRRRREGQGETSTTRYG